MFSELYLTLFKPLIENKKPVGGPAGHAGRRRASKLSPHGQRRRIIEQFISRWREEVGNDFYPALRLILPDKDRDRGVYGLKEAAIGKLLVKLIKIDKNSDDGFSLLKWRIPGGNSAAHMTGDFAGRCFTVLKKRQVRSEPGDMTIADVNELLDNLSAATGEGEVMPIMKEFYTRMNAVEMMWLIRIILKQMKVGATERTFLDIWHPDAEALFNVSSSLRRVCWELYDPKFRMDGEKTSVTPMECFQPQLAQFQMGYSFQKIVAKLRVSEEDLEYWVEEKLDGERMQMHVVSDLSIPGGKKFAFWSRKGKDYTYLYGEGFEDNNSALSRHLKGVLAPSVHNIILDGEMITWDPSLDKIMPFGTLKTAALSEQKNVHDMTGPRPLFKVFDLLYLNDVDLTSYDLRTRYRFLKMAIQGVHRRLEIHPHESATSPDAIEPLLRKVVADSSEGLVLKNPRSVYTLNSRNDDWIKVKPDYMTEFGEALDCVVIGGYWGSGRRGGMLSSFLCGLRAGQNHIQSGCRREKCFSFFKVGGGFKAEDYGEIKHHTEGKWIDWDAAHPPNEFIELGGGPLQHERPDVWIKPSDSVILEVKAASVAASDQFSMGFTLRFPRFRRLRLDKNWDQGLDVGEFTQLKRDFDIQQADKTMSIENRKQRSNKRTKRQLVIAGTEAPASVSEDGAAKNRVFDNIEFCILSDSLRPQRTKAQLENLVKSHGGRVGQRADNPRAILVADKKVVKVASIIKSGEGNIIRSRWLHDCIAQNEGNGYLLPFETTHLFHASEDFRRSARKTVDSYGDSYFRDADTEELKSILGAMDAPKLDDLMASREGFLDQLEQHGHDFGMYRGVLFRRCKLCLARCGGVDHDSVRLLRTKNYIRCGGGAIGDDMMDESVTHVVLVARDGNEKDLARRVGAEVCKRRKVPRIVTMKWVEDCFTERVLLDEDRDNKP